ncbi:MAG: WYL domain-containing protein [Acidobacteria bacterium]|nr:MAG: WYL domain-containing protein [Acidobacteriota bacterium]
MPRNDQVTRQWHLLRHLEAAQHGATLAELATSLPADFTRHPRTIRRDLEALEAAGFPLYTDRVDGRVVWRLVEGFRRAPALAFSPTELMALTFSRGLLKPLEGTQLQAALDSALAKATADLPAPGHTYLQQLDNLLAIGFGSHVSYREHRETIDKLTEAIGRRRTVQMRYFSASRNATTRREVDPYRLWYANGALYLVAHCHLRGEVRLFAVERIRSCTPTDHAYQLPLHFDLEAYVQDALRVMRGGRPVTVELLFDKATAAWVKDRTWHPSRLLKNAHLRRSRAPAALRRTPEVRLAPRIARHLASGRS